jgi:hypothetical protein
MRRLVAVLLLVCFGMMVPAAAVQLRLCTVDDSLVYPTGVVLKAGPADDGCCEDCSRTPEPSPCCFEVEKLPEVTPPPPPEALPALSFWELPAVIFASPVRILSGSLDLPASHLSFPPSAHQRAWFGVWTI